MKVAIVFFRHHPAGPLLPATLHFTILHPPPDPQRLPTVTPAPALTPTAEPSPALPPQNAVSADGDCTLRGRAVSCKAFREQVTMETVDDMRGLDCNSMANQAALRIDGSATAEVTGRVGDCCRFSGLGWVTVADSVSGGLVKEAPVPGHPPLTS